jgi:hypothetical protein
MAVLGIRDEMRYFKLGMGCGGGVGLAVAYKMGAIGPALTAIGAVGCLWAIGTSTLSSRPPKDKHYLMDHYLRPEMNPLFLMGAFNCFNQISEDDDCEQIDRILTNLITPEMPHFAQGLIINAVVHTNATDRELVFAQASRLITQDMSGIEKGSIITSVRDSPADERAARVQRALDQIPQDIENGLANGDLVLRMGTILQTPLDEAIPPLNADMNELAAQGQNRVNVHHGTRDAKTREAIELLQEQQGPLVQKDIDAAVEEFEKFLNDSKDLDLKAKAQQALGGKGANESWPPLLNDHSLHAIDYGRLQISGEELIARLWIFANEHAERDNCRYAMIKALSDSIEGGVRICPPGQAQHLVTGVLQGRIVGVDVDGVRPKLNEVVNRFLQSNQNCESRALLLSNAEEFLTNNPDLVNRDAFLNEINIFADSLDIK